MNFDTIENIDSLLNILKKGISNPQRAAFLWVGAGLSIPAGYPSLAGLAERLRKASVHKLGPDAQVSPLEIIDTFVDKNGKGLLLEQLSDIFENRKAPLPYHRDLVSLPWKGIVTTNYDELLENALKESNIDYKLKVLEENLDINPGSTLSLYKIHGDITSFQKTILDSQGYKTYDNRYPLLKTDLESLLRKHSLVFFGCGMRDERLIGWLRKLGKERREYLMPSCCVMARVDWESIPQEEQDLLLEGNIKPLLLENHAQIPELISYHSKKIPSARQEKSFTFRVDFNEDKSVWNISLNEGAARVEQLPWRKDDVFLNALEKFWDMGEKPVAEEKDKDAFYSFAVAVGEALSRSLFGQDAGKALKSHKGGDNQPPLVLIESHDDFILSLPWELIRIDGEFIVREAKVDLARCALSGTESTLSPPDRPFSLLVNVSAPESESSRLDYEGESYRIARIFQEQEKVRFTELGTLEDIMGEIEKHEPMGIHFSGHGLPAGLVFEDDEGGEDAVNIEEMIRRVNILSPKNKPKFFYLASCHGNTPGKPTDVEGGSRSSAARLHGSGFAQVVGYFGPVADLLSTKAEVALYGAIAQGKPTRHGIRKARLELGKGYHALENPGHKTALPQSWWKEGSYPFAWAQLVFYHRGPDLSLGLETTGKRTDISETPLERTFADQETRRILTTGFIGRRREIHRFRRDLREGKRVFVFQGFGGLGKTALAFKVLALPLASEKTRLITLWCQEVEEETHPAAVLVSQFSEACSKIFGEAWNQIIQAVDHQVGESPVNRMAAFLQILLQQGLEIVVYLDNMESLLEGVEDGDPNAFGEWRDPECKALWGVLAANSGKNLLLAATCRYTNPDFNRYLTPVSHLSWDAVLRMMPWFPGLRRLSPLARIRLTEKLSGHPRAVEYLNDIIVSALDQWEDKKGRWTLPETQGAMEREWRELIEPALPAMEETLKENLLLETIWKKILDEDCRAMLIRLTVLRRPWDWELMCELGEAGGPKDKAEKSAERLRKTSLLTQLEEKDVEGQWTKLYQLHPMVARFVEKQEGKEGEKIRKEALLRAGTFLEELAETSKDIMVDLDAGHYLFQAGEFNRANELLGNASQALQGWGRVREGLNILKPFLEDKEAREGLAPELMGRLLGTMGLAHDRLAEVDKAIEYHEQALVISREIGDRRGEGNRLGNLGLAYADLGKIGKAIEYYEKALLIQREIGDKRGEGNQLGNLGLVYADLGKIDKAIEYYEKALVIQREIGDRRGEGTALGNLGLAYAGLGKIDKAIEYYEKALVISREIGDRGGEGNHLGNMGAAYFILGQTIKAIEYYEQALFIAKNIGERRNEGNWLGNLGSAYGVMGEVPKAIEYYDQALVIAKEIGDRRGEGNQLGNLGSAYLQLGQKEKGTEYLEQCLKIAIEIQDPRMEEFAQRILGGD